MLDKQETLQSLDKEIRELEELLKRKKMERNYLEKGWLGAEKHAHNQILRRAEKLNW